MMFADEPERLGGTDSGPTPYGWLLGALGSCTAMTLRMYADHKRWPLQDVEVRLRHERDYQQDCTDCAEGSRRIERIERSLVLTGPLTAAQRERLLEIADRCPVHRTISGALRIDTRLDT